MTDETPLSDEERVRPPEETSDSDLGMDAPEQGEQDDQGDQDAESERESSETIISRRRRRRRGGGGGERPPGSVPEIVARTPQVDTLQTWPVVAGGLLLGALLYKAWFALSPPILGGFALFLLYPFRQNRFVSRLMGVTALTLLVWFVAETGNTLFPIAIALVLAYLFNPFITRLERWGVPRGLAILLLITMLVGVLVSLAVFVAPIALDQLHGLTRRIPLAVQRISAWVEGPVLSFLANTLRLDGPEELRNRIVQGVSQEWQTIAQRGLTTLIQVVSGFATVLGALSRVLELIAIPFITFYLLKDFVAFQLHVKALVPLKMLGAFLHTMHDIDDVLGRYIRGQLLVCVIVGILTGLTLWLTGIDYPLILGVLTGILNLIPYFGFMVSLGLGILVALFTLSVSTTILKVVVVYIGLNILESSVISPRIVGHQVGLHPAWVIVSLLVFFHFFGVLGLLIAVPTTAVLGVFARRWYRWYQDSSWYNRR